MLGGDTPPDTLGSAADSLGPALVVVTAVVPERVRPVTADLRTLARRHRLVLGGSGADEETAAAIGARFLAGDPVAAADEATADVQSQATGA